MRYFDEQLINSSSLHNDWWNQLCANRAHFHDLEEQLSAYHNQSAVLPRDAWFEMDTITRRVMRHDEGQAWMADLMPLAKAVSIGKIVHMSRTSSDAGSVTRSISGQVPTNTDKVVYSFSGDPVPVFSTAYGREWREWNTLQSENFDALSDDQEAHTAKIRRDQAKYVLDGDDKLVFENYRGMGIRNHTHSKSINLGSAAGGVNVDLSAPGMTADQIDAFFTGPFGAMLDDNFVSQPVNLYISPEIARNWDRPYSGAAGTKSGSIMDHIAKNRRIAKIASTHELSGNEFFGFVPSSEYIRPLVGMATNTTAVPRFMPTANYDFLIIGAMGINIRADFQGKGGVFYSEVVN